MDIDYFLKNRTQFIKYFYINGVKTFEETISLIEDEKEPFVPVYSEDSEPPFLEEWLDAKLGMETIGQTSISMLSASLKLFVDEWLGRFTKEVQSSFKPSQKSGWKNEFVKLLSRVSIDSNNCPSDLDIIEQIVLVRNRIQHPEHITNLTVKHSKKDLEKYALPFFMDELQASVINSNLSKNGWLIEPAISVTKEKLIYSIEQVELLTKWLEDEYWQLRRTNK